MLSSSCLSDVPEEIWLQIFKAYLDTAHAAALAPDLDRRTIMPHHHAFLHSNLFVLSAVCKDWRSLCLNNSILWSTLYLCFWTYYDDRRTLKRRGGKPQLLKKVINGMELWLSRAKKQPLFISFNIHPSTHPRPCTLITGRAQQIQTLDIRLPPNWYNAFDKLDFPLLTTLKVQVSGVKVNWNGTRSRWATMTAPLDLSQCPRLSSVEVTGTFSHNQIVLPWHQIVKIQLSEVVPRDLVEVLKLLPNIEECLMDFGGSDCMGHDFPTGRVRARNLKSLTLKNVGYKAVSILRTIPLHLCSLRVRVLHMGFDGYEARDKIFDPILPFSDTLLSLSINLCPSTSRGRAKYIDFLSQFRSLVTLELLTEKMLYKDFIEALLMVPGRLPNLRSVTINWQFASNVYDDVLLAALRFRRNVDAGLNVGSEEPPAPHAGAVLERFELQCWSAESSESPGASIKPELMQLVMDGLKLKIFDRRTGLYTP